MTFAHPSRSLRALSLVALLVLLTLVRLATAGGAAAAPEGPRPPDAATAVPAAQAQGTARVPTARPDSGASSMLVGYTQNRSYNSGQSRWNHTVDHGRGD
jgi:hypothetical protein